MVALIMTWRDEPFTKGDFVDALDHSISLIERGGAGLMNGVGRIGGFEKSILKLVIGAISGGFKDARDYVVTKGEEADGN